MLKVSIIIPTYNEAKNIPLLIEEIFNFVDKSKIDLEFIIVDDNSPDGTGRVAEELSLRYPIKVIHRSGKLGLGSAVRAGFEHSKRDYVGVMDGDMSHDPMILNEMIMSLADCDIAIGSRFEEGGGVEEDWGLHRKIIAKTGKLMARALTKAKDPLSGYFFLQKDLIKNIKLTTNSYKILFEILIKSDYKKVKEFPYTFRTRKHSASKLNSKEFLLFFKQVIVYSFYKISKLVKNGKFK